MKKNTTTPPAQAVLPLAYEEIKEESIVGRKTIREMAANKETSYGRQSYHIKYDIIQYRPGFNGRIKPAHMSEKEWEVELDIEAQAMDMLANGHHAPIVGDLINDGKLFLLTDGERRWRGMGWLLRKGHTHYTNGKEIAMVEVFFNPRETTEEQRLLLMLSTDSKKNYKPLELGHMFLRLEKNFLYSHDKIAKTKGISRQQVDNMINLALEPQEIQDAILSGKLLPTAALELINKEKDPAKRVEIVTGSVNSDQKLKVKDVAKITKYKEYQSLMAAVVEQYNDDIITYDKAVEDVNLIGTEANTYIPGEKKDIDECWNNTLEVLDNNKANKLIHTIPAEETKEQTPAPATPPGAATPTVNEAELEERFKAELTDYNEGKTDFLTATSNICNIGLEATKIAPKMEEKIDQLQRNCLTALEQLKKLKDKDKVGTVETKAAIAAEEESRQTSGTYKEPSRPKDQGDDALEKIDFKKDKEMGEMELNEAIKTLDKLVTKMDVFPKNLKQYVDDIVGLAIITQKKIQLGIDVIKKASDER